MSNIQLIIGSVYGAAEQVGDLLRQRLEACGHHVRVNTYPSPDDLLHNADEVFLLCHSNTGSGELPDNLQPLYLHLTRDFPRLAGRRFGAVNLADSSYLSFNEAGDALAAAMLDIGVIQIGERLVLDASSADDTATMVNEWADTWIPLMESVAS